MSNQDHGRVAAVWLRQLIDTGHVDPALTDTLAAKLATGDWRAADGLLAALQLGDTVRLGDVEFTLEDSEELDWLEAAGFAAATAPTPNFDLSFLPPAAPAGWATDQVAAAITQGRQWVQDTLHSLYILLSPPGLAAQAVRSATPAPNAPLANFSLPAAKDFGWDVYVQADPELENAQLCQVKVAVKRPRTRLDHVTVTILHGADWQTATTDPTGMVVFAAVPITELDDLVIHIETPAA